MQAHGQGEPFLLLLTLLLLLLPLDWCQQQPWQLGRLLPAVPDAGWHASVRRCPLPLHA